MRSSESKKGIFVLVGVVAVLAVVGNALLKKEPTPVEPVDKSPTELNIASSTLEPMNPIDYSGLQPGIQFYDDYWHGTVTIAGKEGSVSYQEMTENANGRLIAVQDGMVIYVEKDENYQPQTDLSAVQVGEDDTPISEEDAAFYSKPSITLEGRETIPADANARLFPNYGWAGLRYAVKQYLMDIGLPDVTTLTVDPATVEFASIQRGFQCTMDAAEGTVHVTFDVSTGMWRFGYSELEDGNAYMSYNPIDFVVPSSREAAKKELNEIVGYEKF